MATEALLTCYNKGCGKKFKVEENNEAEAVCVHHPGVPVFHDALKGWSCCKKRVTDFTEFLNIAGCTTSCHSNVKPPEPEKPPAEKQLPTNEVIEVNHRKPKSKEPAERPSDDLPKIPLKKTVTDSLKKALAKHQATQKEQAAATEQDEQNDEVKPGTACKNSACKASYIDETSNDDRCWHHPGVPIFHEGYKFWTCCRKRTSDFNEFVSQEGCTSGSHRWQLTEEEKKKKVLCRYDWFQMGNSIVLSVYAKLVDPESTVIQANKTTLSANIMFGESSAFELELKLHGVIDPDKSSVQMSPTKVEIKLCKADIGAWGNLELKSPQEGKS